MKLNKGLYGLKQASRSWNAKRPKDLKHCGFEQCVADPFAFRIMNGKVVKILLVIHADDILLVYSEEDCDIG